MYGERNSYSYVSKNEVLQFAGRSVTTTSSYVTINKTLGAVVASGAAIPWDPLGASQNITSGATFSVDGKTITLPSTGAYDIEFVSFPGNLTMSFALFVNNVQVLPVGTGAVGGTVLAGRFRATVANSELQVRNVGAGAETLSGAQNAALLSLSFVSA